LAKLDLSRRVAIGVPNFLSALFVVAESDLVSAVPERMAALFAHKLALEIFEPPFALPGFRMLMHWHERVQLDPAHVWLRAQVAAVAAALPTPHRNKPRSEPRPK
jgi:DNA-binding transcriptional LysR family regulator